MSLNPIVTVIAVCYNHAKYVRECLQAIENQQYPHIQLIIIDDASQDQSALLIEEWLKQCRLKNIFIKHIENQGLCRSLNEALSYASGKYIAITATDDLWLAEKISHQVEMLEALPENVGVVYSDAYMIDENCNLLPTLFIPYHRQFEAAPEGDIYSDLVKGNFIPAMTTLIRRQCYERVGLYDERLCYEDYDMWLRIAQHYKFAYSKNIATKYRVLPHSLSHRFHSDKAVDFYFADIEIGRKCLLSGLLDDELTHLVKHRIYSRTKALFENRSLYRFKAFWIVLQHYFSLKICALFLLSLILPLNLEKALIRSFKKVFVRLLQP